MSTVIFVIYRIITSFNDEKLRLVDDAFGRICNCVCDLSVQVRVKAVSLLGQMKNVSLHYLEQTLEKKLMSNMRVSKITFFLRTDLPTGKFNPFEEKKI